MNLLFTYILAAMISWVPLNEGGVCYWPVSQACLDRANKHYQEIAKDIAEVVYEPNIKLPFIGDNIKVKTALLMASIASTESQFHQNVDDCHVVGDHGVSFGLWQTQSPRAITCNDRKQALRIAITMVNQSLDACKNLPLVERLSVYASGSCNNERGKWHSRRKFNRAINYLKDHPFTDAVDTTADNLVP